VSQQEDNERAAAAVTSYGLGTRSYNKSAEKREMDRQRKEATEKYLESKKTEVLECERMIRNPEKGAPARIKCQGKDPARVKISGMSYSVVGILCSRHRREAAEKDGMMVEVIKS